MSISIILWKTDRRSPRFPVFVWLAILSLSFPGCSRDEVLTKGNGQPKGDSNAPLPDGHSDTRKVPVLGNVGDFLLTDQFKRLYGTQELRGNLAIAHFFFTTCPSTCPQQMSTMSRLDKWLEKQPFAKYTQLLNITVDPQTDTPEVLRKYAAQFEGQEDSRWVFLSGEPHEIRTLAEEQLHLPISSGQATENMPIGHSTKLILIDPIGRVRGYYDALSDRDVAELKKDALAVWSEQVPFLNEAMDPPWLEIRGQAQRNEASKIRVQHEFQFQNRQRESGIRFLHQIVDDAGSDYKGVHYDHGNGLTLADVDNDGNLDLYFTNQLGRNELWRSRGDGTFEDFTDRAGVAVDDRVCVSASFVDIDNDGDCDLYVTAVRAGNLLFRNDGNGQFQDITADSGLGYSGHSSGALFFDYDRDGLLDLFLCNVGIYTTDQQGRGGYYVGFKDAFSGHLKPERTEISRLFRNLDGLHFEDVTDEMGMDEGSWTGDAALIDANRDGWMDLYVLDMQGNDEYYENQQGKSFVRRSREIFPKTPWGAMGVGVFDFDNDEDLDIFVTDMHSDMSKDILADMRSESSLHSFYLEEKEKATMQLPESLLKSEGVSIYGNGFFRNDGPDAFTEISDEIGAENYWPWGLSVGDLNADGFEDVFVASSMNYPFRYAVNSVLLNDQGERFADAEFILGVEPRESHKTAQPWILLDCDREGDELMKKVCTGHEGEIVVWGSLGSRSSVIFDIEGDGDLDIVTSEFNNVPLVLVSSLADEHQPHFIKVRLEGTASNRQAIGTMVTAVIAERRLLRFYDGKVGYLSQGRPELYLGLGERQQVDRLEVDWPSGKHQTVLGPFESGQTVTITEQK